MRIGFDAKRAVQNFTGLGNYSRYVIDILCRFYPDNEYIAYAPKRIENKQTDRLLNRHPQLSLKLPAGFLWRKARSLWRVWGISGQMEKEHTDLFHGLSNELPLNIRRKKIKSIVTIHDLIFLRYPRFYKRIDRGIYSFKFRKACRNADRIIAISECTKRDIVSFFDIDPGKIEVVYQGCDACFSHEATEQQKQEVRQRYSLPRKYVLNVGSIEERKNALLAIKAMEGLPDEVHLVIVGKHTPYTDKIKSYADEKGLPAAYISYTTFLLPTCRQCTKWQRCSSILRVSRDSASRFSKLFTPVCLWWLPQALVWKKQEARTPSTSTPTTWKKRPQLSACYVPMKPKEKR
ncbi:mannosyltransferase [Bacteroides pyogenes DSM 20611 = JCM 6294]|uniref:Mannosyltransferase n=1 Tax=Bacteroides pyogenes DSM 20611 = JCM 6294 TaxID=1121100 RepID=W4PDR8_9BACE|nr:mannosyltransferase [Bacteroides pyogenes DSM 20611 = JCM 6294]